MVAIPDFRSGRMMLKNVLNSPAPSIFADSISAVGIADTKVLMINR